MNYVFLLLDVLILSADVIICVMFFVATIMTCLEVGLPLEYSDFHDGLIIILYLCRWTFNDAMRLKYDVKMAGMNAPIATPNVSTKLKDWESK